MLHAIPSHRTNRKFWSFALIGLGVLLIFGLGSLWPLFILLPGLGMLALSQIGERWMGVFAVPGMLTAGTGGLLLFQALTGYWDSWIYAWTLYGVFLGTGLFMMGKRMEEPSLMQIGRLMSRISGAAFLALGLFVILLTSALFKFILMLALFVAGGYLLFSQPEKSKTSPLLKFKHSDPTVEENIYSVQVETADKRVAS
jgi:hypothetical protein